MNGFNFFDDLPEQTEQTEQTDEGCAFDLYRATVGCEPRIETLAPYLRDPTLAEKVGHKLLLAGSTWYVFADLPPAKAAALAKQIKRNLKGLRNLASCYVNLHSREMYVGCSGGEVRKIE
jgi:hypothetical protein